MLRFRHYFAHVLIFSQSIKLIGFEPRLDLKGGQKSRFWSYLRWGTLFVGLSTGRHSGRLGQALLQKPTNMVMRPMPGSRSIYGSSFCTRPKICSQLFCRLNVRYHLEYGWAHLMNCVLHMISGGPNSPYLTTGWMGSLIYYVLHMVCDSVWRAQPIF